MYAFIVFNEARDMRIAKRTLRRCKLYCSKKYLFWKHYKLTAVDTADSPSNIIWENLEISKLENFARSFTTFIIVVIILIISFGIIYCLKAF